MERTVKLNKVFKEANQTRCRYRVLMGSAGSGKSVNVATDYILKLSDPEYKGANLLVVRETETSHKDSTYAELVSAIDRLGQTKLWNIKSTPLLLENKITGNTVIFRGCADERSRQRIKSITVKQGKLCWVWVEEAFEVAKSSIDLIDDRLRGELPDNLYYQITFTFNPVNAHSYLKTEFWDYKSPDIFTCHSTYLDNRFIDEAYSRRMERRKELDPEGYRVYGLGEWGETGGLILTNYRIEDISQSFESYDKIVYAQDFGYNHANCILEVGFKDDEIYILRELYVHEKDTNEIIELAEKMNFDKLRVMYCDSAEPDRIKMWKRAGYHAVGAKKEQGSVKAQIDYLKQHKIHIHGSCLNTIKEIQQWKWEKDKNTGEYLDEPVDFMDDAMAALRYSIEPYRRNLTIRTMSKSHLGL